ncbi:MAG TPA: YMGG-like glycine zipper-containing protein [Pelomicrobium sp.]|nr:YMGG-like glycine zipper-containing protein [Pelomicrobium sp.]
MIRTPTILILAFGLTACANLSEGEQGALVGAGVGAGVGEVVTDSPVGAAAGAAAGGVLGKEVAEDE